MRHAIWLTVIGFALLMSTGCDKATNKSPVSLVLGETVIYPVNEPPTLQVKQGDNLVMISDLDDYPSPPLISPNGTKLAYISPFEFEMVGHVWLYESSTSNKTEIVAPNQNDTSLQSPMRLLWLDDDRLLIVTGYAIGTIAQKRNLFLYELSSAEFREVYTVAEKQSILEMSISGNDITLQIADYTDDWSEYTLTSKVIQLQDLVK